MTLVIFNILLIVVLSYLMYRIFIETTDIIAATFAVTVFLGIFAFSQYIGHLIVDECHRAPSRTFTEAVTAFDSKYMLGLSATPWRRDKLSKLIFWHLGDVHYEIDKEDLQETGDILKAEVVTRETNFIPYNDGTFEYSRMLSELTQSELRNNLICGDISAAARNGASTVLVERYGFLGGASTTYW